jgi:hypothetical protein
LASSSAMMRRIEARISSIEGSWTFAGCVISDSTSSTPSRALSQGLVPAFRNSRYGVAENLLRRWRQALQNRTTSYDKIRRFRVCWPELSTRRPDLSPVRASHDCAHQRPASGPARAGSGTTGG